MNTLALTDLTHVCFWTSGFAFATGLVCGVIWGLSQRVKAVGKLARTADGYLVGPGTVVYGPSPVEGDRQVIVYGWFEPVRASDGDRLSMPIERCHTTRRGAEAAAGLRTRLRLCQAGACGKERAG